MGRVEEVVETLTVRREEAVLSRICLDFVVYTSGSLMAPKTREGVLSFYQKALTRFSRHWNWLELPDSEGPRRVNAAALELPLKWLAADARGREEMTFTFRDGAKNDDIGTTALEVSGFGTRKVPGYLRLSLPVTFLTQGAPAYAELCESLIADLPFLSGRAGYSLRWDEFGRRHHRLGLSKVDFIAQWYAGIDLPDDSMAVMEEWIQEKLPAMNWLTFFGKPLLAKIPGVETWKNVDAPLACRELPHGLVIQAGAQPETGNSPQPKDLLAYQLAAQALSPWLSKTRAPLLKDDSAWLRRFDTLAELTV